MSLYYSKICHDVEFTRSFKNGFVYKAFIHKLKAGSIASNIIVLNISEEFLQPFLITIIFFTKDFEAIL